MKALRRLATLSAIATYLLIFTGGLVRVSGAGLGCPDWPRCFGRWLPPTSVDQLPPNIDPSMFNFTLAWIEYGNRMIGVVVGLLILTTAILAVVHARRHLRIWLPAVAAAILVAYVGWQGGQVVASGLEPVMVSIHALLSFVIVALLLMTAQQVTYLRRPELERESVYPERIQGWLIGAGVLVLLQVVLGTQLRGAIKLVSEVQPMGGETAWMNAVGPINHLHQMLGMLTAGVVAHVGVKLLIRAQNPTPLVHQGAIAMIALAVIQVAVGLAMVFGSYIPILQLVHLWAASLLVGLVLLLHGAARRSKSFAKEV